MISEMIAALSNHLWQSTLFVLAAGVLALALRKNGAHVRHAIWIVASLKFLVPFAAIMSLGIALWTPTSVPATAPAEPGSDLAVAVDRVAQPFTIDMFAAGTTSNAASPRDSGLALILTGLWAIGFATVALMRVRGWHCIRAAIRASAPLPVSSPIPIRSAPGMLEPGIIGIWRPILLLPQGIEQHLTPAQLETVLAHEHCHVRRRDNLTSAIHMVVEALFWFHPFVWFVGARIVDERERACDEYVLRMCREPRTYAESIINVCKLYTQSPLTCISGVTGSDLKRRLAAILVNRIGVRLNLVRRIALVGVSIAAVVLPLFAGVLTAPLLASRSDQNQAAATAQKDPQRFEVATIKPCDANSTLSIPGGRTGGVGPRFSPGRFAYECGTLEMLINAAYVANGEPLLNDEVRVALGARRLDPTAAFPLRIRGGPDWVRTERFMIEAKAEISTGLPGNQAPERKILLGPMLRTLLEERFQLKLHREIQDEVPMYALTVAPGGLKIKPVGPDGGCAPQPPPGQGPDMDEEIALVRGGGKPICGHGIMGGSNGPNQALVLNNQTMDGVARILSGMLDRHVLDKTGVDGKFIVYMEYAHDDFTPGDIRDPRAPNDPPTAPSIGTVLQEKLGLKLVPTKGPKGYIVIDRVARPSPEAPSAISVRPARAQGAGR